MKKTIQAGLAIKKREIGISRLVGEWRWERDKRRWRERKKKEKV